MVAFGKYRVVEKRGARGSWILYDVVEVALERKAELRVYSNRLPEGSEKERDFLDTLMKVAAIDHPNVVSVWDMGVAMEKGYYTCPPRDAVPLAQALAERELSSLDEVELLDAASQLCAGVDALHQKGLVHGALSAETVYWDRRRCFPFVSWIPVLARNPDELRLSLPPVPSEYRGAAEDLFRLTGLVHHVVTGTGPLADTEVTGHTAAVNVPGAIDGVFEVLEQGLSLDPADNFADVGELSRALDKVLSKQRVRAELEKSVSSMVIPEEVLKKALERKQEQKRRRREQEGVSAAEAPYVNPLEGKGGMAAAAALALVLLVPGYLMFGGGEAPPPPRPPPPRSTLPPIRPAVTAPTRTAPAPSATPTASAAPRGKTALSALRDASPTSNSDFLDRWGTLKGWILSLPPAKRRNLFTYGKLVRLRADFKKDESGACRQLDELIKQAVSESE